MDIREALDSAFTTNDAPEVTQESAVTHAQDTPQAAEISQARDERGKFAKLAEPIAAPITAPVSDAPVRKAPSSWKPEAQSAWTKADKGESLTAEEIRLLAHEADRREGDFHKGVEEFKTHAQKARAYESVVAPYQKTFQSLGMDAPTAISKLLNADNILRTADPATKSQYFAQLAQQYGIDLAQVQAPTPVNPETQYLLNQLNELRQKQTSWETSLQQQEQERANQELAQFNTKENAHFDAVRGEMADLLETGKATTLKDAYEMAVWMRPDIRQSLIEQQRVDEQRKTEERIRAAKVQTASAGIRGSSPSTGVIAQKNSSIRDALEASFAND